jgi:hypothetical protein
MTFNDIPKEDRYISFEFSRNQDMIDKAHERVVMCREFLNQFVAKKLITA